MGLFFQQRSDMDLYSLKVQVHIHKISQSQSVLGLGWLRGGGGVAAREGQIAKQTAPACHGGW
jgi:hypothetical protein